MKKIRFFVFLLLLNSSFVSAHVFMKNSLGEKMRWSDDHSQLRIFINPQNNLGASQSEIENIASFSIDQWNQQTRIPMIPSITPMIKSEDDGKNSISFASGAHHFMGSGILAVTITSMSERGRIIEGDIIVNDGLFSGISMNPNDPSFLGGVLTHELGHLLGLGHSEVLNSSMVYTTFFNQQVLADDDRAAARTLYPKQNYGKINGRVIGGSHVGIFGVHIQAFSLRKGRAVAGVISREDGSFEIDGLDVEDDYYLFTSPIRYTEALPNRFLMARRDFCPTHYSQSFYSSCASLDKGKPYLLSFAGKRRIEAGNITVSCDQRVNSYYLKDKIKGIEDKGTLFVADQINGGMSFAGYFFPSSLGADFISTAAVDQFSVDLSRFEHPDCGANLASCYLMVQLNSLDLGSPMSLELAILESAQVTTGEVLEVKRPLNTFINQQYTLQIKAKADDLAFKIPSQSVFRTKVPMYLLSVTIRRDIDDAILGKKSTEFEDNSTCPDAPFAYNVSSRGDSFQSVAATNQKSRSKSNDDMIPSCGSVDWDGPASGGGFVVFCLMTLVFYLLMIERYNKSLSKE